MIAILAAAGLGAGMILIRRERAEAARERDRTRHHRYVADIRQAYELVQNGQGQEVVELINKWVPAPGEPDERNFAWYYLKRPRHDERRTLRGHAGDVYHAEFSPDGRTLVSCGKDGTVRFWEVATGRPIRTIPAHTAEVNEVAFAPDGRTLATVGDDGTIKIWDVETAAERATVAAHKGDAIAVRFTPDGRRLISAGRDDIWSSSGTWRRSRKSPRGRHTTGPSRTWRCAGWNDSRHRGRGWVRQALEPRGPDTQEELIRHPE